MSQPRLGRILVDPAALRVESRAIGALPVVNVVKGRRKTRLLGADNPTTESA
ncbi:MAG: hypothetical protein M0035_16185 [Actinomycetota bacterium]|jgi:hypothetical protein|nr:hypothetical protein [Actinomycetota bacterium]